MKPAKFAAVLDWLDNYPEETVFGFNMTMMFKSHEFDFKGHYCGTVMCIAGAVAYFDYPERDYRLEDCSRIAARILGLTKNEARELFYADGSDLLLEEITPKMAADTIRKFIATGEIRWPKHSTLSPETWSV